MSITFLIGRIAFVAIFLFSGIQKLMGISATAAYIQSKFVIPAALGTIVASAEGATGMTAYQLLAIVVGVVEILFPLLIIFNIVTRFAALVMLVFVGLVTFIMHDFWNMTDAAAYTLNQTAALKNLSIMGGFLILMVVGGWRPEMYDEDDYPA
jgi:putative oxidoreductase